MSTGSVAESIHTMAANGSKGEGVESVGVNESLVPFQGDGELSGVMVARSLEVRTEMHCCLIPLFL